jgi:small ligand-binding sensory domain FIST
MRFATAFTTHSDAGRAIAHLREQLVAHPFETEPQLALVFFSPNFAGESEKIANAVREATLVEHIIGCTGGGIIGPSQEIEGRSAISVMVAALPQVQVQTFRLLQHDVEESSGPAFWHYQLDVEPKSEPNFIILADPFTIQAIELVRELGEAYPKRPVIGGLASGAREPGHNRLVLDDEIFDEGGVGVALCGNIQLHAVVSQGCRPIGQPLVVTRSERNVIFEIGGQPPLTVLQNILPTLPPRDQQLAKTALFLGRVINEYQEEFSRGDFLIRNLVGYDPQSGALAVGDYIQTGQTVQFQVRDGTTADEDLRHMLGAVAHKTKFHPPKAALLFSCLGRGKGMYGVPNHDVMTIRDAFGPLPLTGFFCNGEIGPIGDKTFVHGFTSVIGLLTEKQPLPQDFLKPSA